MAKSILDIVIKLAKQGNADTETVKGLVNIKSSLLQAGAVAGSFMAAGYAVDKMLDATVGTMVTYADQVRRIHDATGASAEDSSKLIQILDDQKVSYEQLEKVVAKSGKTFDFSINGIANMSEEFGKLTDKNEQAAFMQERFGKQWISFVPIMQEGKDAILEAADAVNESLILDQRALTQTREYEKAIDDLADAKQGLAIATGKELLPVEMRFIELARDLVNTLGGQGPVLAYATRQGLLHRDALDGNVASYTAWARAVEEQKAALDENTAAAEENEEAIKAITKAHQDMLGLIGKVASAEQNYQETSKSLNEERIQIEQERAAAIQAGWWEGSDKIKDFDKALEENALKAEENAARHHEAMGKIQYDLLLTKLSTDGLTDAEFEMAQQAGLAFGVFDQESVEAARNMDILAQSVIDGKLKVEELQAAMALLSDKRVTLTVDQVTNIIRRDTVEQVADRRAGYASGGVSVGSEGGHWELLHGTEGIFTKDQMAHLAPVGSAAAATSVAGGGNVYINLTIASPMTILDEQSARRTLLPMIVDGYKEAQARGAIPGGRG